MAVVAVTISGPACEPIHLDEAKRHLREELDESGQDLVIRGLIAQAREMVEGQTDRKLICSTIRERFSEFADVLTLTHAPVLYVSSIVYLDANGDEQTLDEGSYRVDSDSTPCKIEPAYGESWPATISVRGAVTVTYVAGHAAMISSVDAASNTLTVVGRTLANGDVVRMTNTGGALPSPLTTHTDYHVRDYAAGAFKLAATSGGSAIDLTDAGTGTSFVGEVPNSLREWMLLMVGHWYENREASVTGTTTTTTPFVQSLIERWAVYTQ